ncbi:MAG: hypothetical protein KDD67_03435 [Ignavibacteriae bacterium]|nr:hypothetical protein [Ignavibacteriota bacterium]MCB9217118.1 hypothetical protein [Ignavibacteria bacterium]
MSFLGFGGAIQYSHLIRFVDSPDLISDTGFIDPPHGRRFDIFAVGASRLNDYFMVGVGLGASHFSVAHRGDFTFSRESYLAPSALVYANVVFQPVTLGYAYAIAVLPEDAFGSHSPPPDLHILRFGLIFDFKKGG